jgi:hypothetical protein
MTTTTVHDMIVTWAEVCEGDLVVLNDELVIAERVSVYQDTWNRDTGETFTRADIFHRLDNGVQVASERHGDSYTAVRRHDVSGAER